MLAAWVTTVIISTVECFAQLPSAPLTRSGDFHPSSIEQVAKDWQPKSAQKATSLPPPSEYGWVYRSHRQVWAMSGFVAAGCNTWVHIWCARWPSRQRVRCRRCARCNIDCRLCSIRRRRKLICTRVNSSQINPVKYDFNNKRWQTET